MKTNKLMMAVAAVLVFSNMLFAGNPNQQSEKSAQVIIAKLDKDVQLTDSQKTILQKKAKELYLVLQNENSKSEKKSTIKKQTHQQYKALLDSVLTASQKQQLLVKKNERKNK